jgi:PAS domain S-box-containing protein
MIVVILLSLISIGSYWFIYENRNYREEYDKINTESLDHQKLLIKREVDRTVSYIEYVRSMTLTSLMDKLNNRVDLAYEIANNIYNEYRGKKSENEIREIILTAIKPYSLGQNKDFVFIYTLQGVGVFVPENLSLEGKSALSLRDSSGNYLIQREVNLMKEVDKGFISYYFKKKNRGDSTVYRTTYLRKFEPLNWYFGSKEYLSDYESSLKKEALNHFSSYKFDNDGYIFIQNVAGKPLLSNGLVFSSDLPENIAITEDERLKISDRALKGGGFVEYQYHRPGKIGMEPKVAYIKYIDEWDWVIGAGFYTYDIDKVINAKREILNDKRLRTLTNISVSLVLILTIGVLLIGQTVKRMNFGLSKFERFFNEASNTYRPINVQELYTTEFVNLANSANKMITELKEVRLALEKEQSLLLSVINSIPDMIFFKDLDSRYVGCNKAFEDYIGLRQQEISGKTDFELFPKEVAEFYTNNDQQILEDGAPIRNEEWISFNGKRRLHETVKALVHNRNNEVTGILCISRDITDKALIQKRYIEAKEKAEESDRLKTAFLANMSHEIRTPMNSIVGFSNLIADGGLSAEEQKEYAGYIDVAANSLLNLINDIIDIAKIEAGQLTIKPEYISLSKLFDEVFQLSHEYIKKADKENLKLSYTIEKRLEDKKFLSDPYRLNQVLINLITNAIKFTPSGTINFSVELIDTRLLFKVKDTGIGISKKDQELLFTRFRQVGENKELRVKGTGLGLAISKHIVDLMLGTVWVESEKGIGSTFCFEIPYYPQEEENTARGLLIKDRWKDKVIVVIDKEDASFNYFKAIIGGTGAKIIRTYNCSEALNVLKENSEVNLIYTDYNCSDQDFQRFIQEVKLKSPELPLVLQTSSNEAESVKSFCDSFIIKPVQYHLLLESLDTFMV